MKAFKIRPEDAAETYADADKRDLYTVEHRIAVLEELESHHILSREAGGPDGVQEYGFPWIDYPNGQRGRLQRQEDCRYIKRQRERYGTDISLFTGDRGQGKTLLAVVRGRFFYSIGYALMSNIGIDFGHRLEGGVDILGMTRSRHNTMWLIDEVHQSMSKWTQQSKFQRGVVGAFAALRKQLSGALFITSQENQLGIDVKSETKWFVYPYRPNIPQRQIPGPPFLRTRAREIGPKPYRGKTLADEWQIKAVRSASAKQVLWRPTYWELEAAAASYGSFIGIPTRRESGGDLKAAQINEIDVDGEISLIDVIDYDAPDDPMPDMDDADGVPRLTIEEYATMLCADGVAVFRPGEDHLDLGLMLTRIAQNYGSDKYDRKQAETVLRDRFGFKGAKVIKGPMEEWVQWRLPKEA